MPFIFPGPFTAHSGIAVDILEGAWYSSIVCLGFHVDYGYWTEHLPSWPWKVHWGVVGEVLCIYSYARSVIVYWSIGESTAHWKYTLVRTFYAAQYVHIWPVICASECESNNFRDLIIKTKAIMIISEEYHHILCITKT